MSIAINFSRRSALQLLTTMGAGLLAACSPAATPAATTPAQPATGGSASPVAGGSPSASPATASAPAIGGLPSTGTPRNGGVVRFGIPADINRLDAHFRLNDAFYAVFDRLIQYDENLKPQPMLAESWEVSADAKQYKFNLRKGVQLHNGKEVDSTVVKLNSERARDLPNTQLAEAKWWNTIETPDKYTVIFKSELSRPIAFDYFEYLNITDPATADDTKVAIGTGPFVFKEWNQGTSFTLAKNPSYWQSGKPYLDGIEAKVITDPQAMTTTFEAGTLEVATVPAQDFARLKDKGTYTAYQFYNGNVAVVGVQTQTAPWNNKKARQALAYAINRDRWARTINYNLEAPNALPWTESSPAFDATKNAAYTYNMAKAKQLLQEAGVTGTFNQELVLQTGNASYAQFAQVFQADMAQLGFTLSIRPMDNAAYLDTVNNGKYNGFWMGAGAFTHLDPASAFTKSRAFSPNGNSSAFAAPANADAVALVDRATTEPDPAKRKEIYAQLNDMLFDEGYVFNMSQQSGLLLLNKKVQNVLPTKHAAQQWWNVWLSA